MWRYCCLVSFSFLHLLDVRYVFLFYSCRISDVDISLLTSLFPPSGGYQMRIYRSLFPLLSSSCWIPGVEMSLLTSSCFRNSFPGQGVRIPATSALSQGNQNNLHSKLETIWVTHQKQIILGGPSLIEGLLGYLPRCFR